MKPIRRAGRQQKLPCHSDGLYLYMMGLIFFFFFSFVQMCILVLILVIKFHFPRMFWFLRNCPPAQPLCTTNQAFGSHSDYVRSKLMW